jgi:hypothetical protein
VDAEEGTPQTLRTQVLLLVRLSRCSEGEQSSDEDYGEVSQAAFCNRKASSSAKPRDSPDVYTSGATAHAAASALRAAGEVRVDVVTFARAIRAPHLGLDPA